MEIATRKVVVRVGGYPISYESPEEGWAAFQQEFQDVSRLGAGDVRVMRCEHLPHSRFASPRWDITLSGVPEGRPGFLIPSADSQGRDQVWEVRGVLQPPPPPGEARVSGGPLRCRHPPPMLGCLLAQGGKEGDVVGAPPMEGVDAAAHVQRPDLL